MARFLAIDWDQQQVRVVEANVGGGKVRIVRAAAWPGEGMPTPANAEEMGRRLRQRFGEAGIAPAPVLACVGRDRVILKEISYPPVPLPEEPALVRFQVVKELTEAVEDVVIDYVPTSDPQPSGQRHALVLIARRDLLMTYQATCRAAGLRLQALTAQPFGIAACVEQLGRAGVLAPPPAPAGAAVAVLALAESWAEFCVVRDGTLLFARSLNPGAALADEVRRNLAVYAAQANQRPVRSLYVADSGEHAVLRERLQGLVKIPVHAFDPFLDVERPELPAKQRGAFAGAAGLLYAYGQQKALPIDFVQPRQPRAARTFSIAQIAVAAAVLFVLVSSALGGGYLWIHAPDAEIAELNRQRDDRDSKIPPGSAEQEKSFNAVRDWVNTNVVWLDELYDLTAVFPEPTNTQLREFRAEPLAKANSKEKDLVAKMSIRGVTREGDRPIDELRKNLGNLVAGYKIDPKKINPNTSTDRSNFSQEFRLELQTRKRSPASYKELDLRAPGSVAAAALTK